jgi:hypothetical protein
MASIETFKEIEACQEARKLANAIYAGARRDYELLNTTRRGEGDRL